MIRASAVAFATLLASTSLTSVSMAQTPASSPAPASGGLRGRLETAVGTRRVTPREVPSGAGAREGLVPAVDRETQLARLRSVRSLFG